MFKSVATAFVAVAVSCLLGAEGAPAATAPTWGCPGSAAAGVTCINGGGSTASQNAYVGASRVVSPTLTYPGGELWQYATANPAIGFSYEGGQSTPAQQALRDNLPSDFTGNTAETGYAVHFAASESYVTSSSPLWAYVGAGHPLPGGGGQFMQIPMWGTEDVIPVLNPKMTYNGAAVLTDNDLCGIFSGKLTTWAATSAAGKMAQGTIKVYWRADNGGASASFLLTQHLAAVCTTSNTKPGITFVKTSKFASLFPNYVAPATSTGLWSIPPATDGSFGNFVAVSGSAGMADGVNNDATGSAIGYVSPDYSAIAAAPIKSGKTKQYTSLFVAAVVNKNDGIAYLPSLVNVNTALTNPGSAPNLNPPSLLPGTTPATTPAAIQTNWVPQISTPAKGYPIVSYSILMLPQCYKNKTIANAMIGLLVNHINGVYATDLQDSGFVPTLSGSATGWGAAVYRTFITNASGLNLNIQNVKACTGVTPR